MRSVTTKEILGHEERLGIEGIAAPAGACRDVRHLVRYDGSDGGMVRPPPPGSLVIVPPDRPGCNNAGDGWSGFSVEAYSGGVSCVALSGRRLTALHHQFSESTGIPLFSSIYDDSLLYSRLTGLLREMGGRRVMVHGVLVRIAGTGILILGESGTGKTACGLALAAEGARWVADDAVVLKARGDAVFGRGHRRTAGWIAVRNRGIMRAADVVGEGRLLAETRVDLIVRIVRGPAAKPGRDAGSCIEIAGVTLPCRELASCGDAAGMAGLVREYVCSLPVKS